MSEMGKTIVGKLAGVIQRENGLYFARISPGGESVIEFPISQEQFHKLPLKNQKCKLILEIE